MKIATWNVNSLNIRLQHVLQWLSEHQPDVLALQETKVLDDKFPIEAIHEAGYQVVFSGQKTYNGVAILSKKTASDIVTDFPSFTDPQRRILGATINDVRVLNLYVPNGSSVGSEKYAYKLDWLAHLEDYVEQEITKYDKFVMLGDFNIAPADLDVHDPAAWRDAVLCSQKERAALEAILELGMIDVFREKHDDAQYSWWDYRQAAFRRNLGLRIDLILANATYAEQCKQILIDTAPRKLERPSDHAPVVASFSS
jgi:exodeoxyribonuclease-3